MYNKNKNKNKNDINAIYKRIVFIFIIIFHISFFIYINNARSKFIKDDLTLVSAYYRIKSKHLYEEYLAWLDNLVRLNKSFVFFTNKEFMPILKKMRPIEYHYKTVFIELEMEKFYSYKNFYKEFNQSFGIDIENKIHTVPLYLIWAEKFMFLKKAIFHNYFNSKCFYWIDAGYFRDEKNIMQKYLYNWPSIKKCFSDKRLLMGQVRNFSENEKRKIINFDIDAHKRLQRSINVAGNFFGGQAENIIKFGSYYYNALKLFIRKKIFVGKDQNIFTYVAFKNPKIINLVPSVNYMLFKSYLS